MRLIIEKETAVISPNNDWAVVFLGVAFIVFPTLIFAVLFMSGQNILARPIPLLIPPLFVIAGSWLIYFCMKPRKFDRVNDCFWFGFGEMPTKMHYKISDIESLIVESPSEIDSDSWSLSAKMKNKKIIHLAYYSRAKAIKKSSKDLADFLHVAYECSQH